jgi:long-chain acyl-CoA synthetase
MTCISHGHSPDGGVDLPPNPPISPQMNVTPPAGGAIASAKRPFWQLDPDVADSPCLVTDDGRVLSKADLQEHVEALKGRLDFSRKALGFVLCRNDLPSLAGYLACLQAGHAVLLLPHDMDMWLLESLMAEYQPDFIWSPRGDGHAGYSVRGDAMEEHRLYCSESGDGHPPISPDLALLLSTSGSTGNPKLVRLSYVNLQANAASIADYLELGTDERPITSLPMHYSYGLSVINSHLLVDATILLTGRKIRSDEFWGFFKEHGATSLAGVPYIYQMLRELGFEHMDLPSLRTLTQAGGHLDTNLQEHFVNWSRQRNIRYYTMYGQTEATARIAYLPPERADAGRGSIGVPIPGGKIEIVDGELVYSGPNVMLGYARTREDLAKGDELGGRLHTGDLARVAKNGLCYIVGRKKRFIKLMGLRINCDDVERQLSTHFGRKCIVLGTDSHMTVAITASGPEDEIIDFIRRTYHIKGSLCSVRVVPEFPLLPAGKVDYASLNRLIEEEEEEAEWQHASVLFPVDLNKPVDAALQAILDLGATAALGRAAGAA